MLNRTARVILLIGIMVLLLPSGMAQVQAQGPLLGAPGVDVVFIIENTVVMGDPNTDGNGRRFDAVTYAADMLSDDVFYLNPDAIHTVSVISFASSADVRLNVTEVGPYKVAESPYNDPALREQRLSDLNKIDSALNFDTQQYVYDGLESAIAQAENILGSTKPGNREQVVFLMMVGKSPLAADDLFFRLDKFRSFMNQRTLQSFILPIDTETRAQFSSLQATSLFIDQYNGHQSTIGIDGTGQLVENANDLPYLVSEMLADKLNRMNLPEVSEIEPAQEIMIPPFASSVIVRSFAPGFEMLFTGNQTGNRVESSNFNQTVVVIENPTPGTYELAETERTHVKLRMATTELTLSTSQLPQLAQVDMTYTARDVFGASIDYGAQQNPAWNVSARVSHTSSAETWTILFSPTGLNGEQVAKFIPPRTGDYDLTVNLSASPELGSETTSIEATPIRLEPTAAFDQADVLRSQRYTFTIAGLDNFALAVNPELILTDQTAPTVPHVLSLADDGVYYTELYFDEVDTRRLVISGTATIPNGLETKTYSTTDGLETLAYSYEVTITAPETGLSAPSVQPIYTNAPVMLNDPSGKLSQATLAETQTQICLIVTDLSGNVIHAPTQPLSPVTGGYATTDENVFVPTEAGTYQLQALLVKSSQNGGQAACSRTPDIIESLAITSIRAEQIYVAFFEGDRLTVPELHQFNTQAATLGLVYQPQDAIAANIISQPLDLPITVTSGTAVHFDHQLPDVLGRYPVTLAAPQTIDPVTFDAQLQVNGTTLPIWNTRDTSTAYQLPVIPADVTVLLEPLGGAETAQQFGNLRITATLTSQTYTVQDFNQAGGSAEAILQWTKGDETQTRTIPMNYVSNSPHYEAVIPLPDFGTYNVVVSMSKAGLMVVSDAAAAPLNVSGYTLQFTPASDKDNVKRMDAEQVTVYSLAWLPVDSTGQLVDNAAPHKGAFTNEPVVKFPLGSQGDSARDLASGYYTFKWGSNQETTAELQATWTLQTDLDSGAATSSGTSDTLTVTVDPIVAVYLTLDGSTSQLYHPWADFWNTGIRTDAAMVFDVVFRAELPNGNIDQSDTGIVPAADVMPASFEDSLIVTVFDAEGVTVSTTNYQVELQQVSDLEGGVRLWLRGLDEDKSYFVQVALADGDETTTNQGYRLRRSITPGNQEVMLSRDEATGFMPVLALVLIVLIFVLIVLIIWIIRARRDRMGEPLTGFIRLVDQDGNLMQWEKELGRLKKHIQRYHADRDYGFAQIDRLFVQSVPNHPDRVAVDVWLSDERNNWRRRLDRLSVLLRSDPDLHQVEVVQGARRPLRENKPIYLELGSAKSQGKTTQRSRKYSERWMHGALDNVRMAASSTSTAQPPAAEQIPTAKQTPAAAPVVPVPASSSAPAPQPPVDQVEAVIEPVASETLPDLVSTMGSFSVEQVSEPASESSESGSSRRPHRNRELTENPFGDVELPSSLPASTPDDDE